MSAKTNFAGKPVELIYTFAALLAMQEQHNVNVYASETFIPSPRLTAVLVWGGLVSQGSGFKLSIQDVAEGFVSIAEANEAGNAAIKELTLQLSGKPKGADDTPGKT